MFENDNTLMIKALNDMLERNYDKAEKRFKKLARKNNAQALYWLGEIYTSKDYRYYNATQALSYYEQSANLGYVLAMSKAGNLYFNNNYQKAIYYYQMGANNNDTYCLSRMGYTAANFNGDSHDYNKAIQYFEATLNDNSEDNNKIVADSANILGQMYWNGMGVEKNQEKAFQYFEKAAKLKNSNALFMIGTCYHYGTFKDKDLTKAINYYQESYKYGYIQAGIELVRIYVEDLDDINKAKELIDKLCDEETLANDEILQIKYYLARVSPEDIAAETYFEVINELTNKQEKLSADETHYYVSSCYELGNIFIKTDVNNAIMAYELAARVGHEESLDVLTKLYHQGQYDNKLGLIKENIKKDSEVKETNKNNDMYQLGNMYYEGNGVQKDASKANQYYLEALKHPDKLSDDDLGDIYCKLGLNYMSGIGIEQDRNKSIKMLIESAKPKNNLAMYMLGLVSEVNKEYEMANQYFMQALTQINHHHNMLNDERMADLYFHMGYNYEYGNGVEADVNKALDYLLEAAHLNHNHAMCILASDLETADMFDQANQWYIKAIAEIDKGNNRLDDKQIGMVYTNLAINYILGRGIEKNTAKAYELLKKAQPYGNEDALNILNDYFDENGKYLGYEEDSEETVREYERKANNGNLEAMDYMGDYYRRHDNDEQAKYWYKRSAARNDNYAMYRLGLMDFGKENSESRQWFTKAMQEIDKGNNMIKKDEDLGDFYSILAMYFHQAAISGDDKSKKWTVEYYTKSAHLNNAAAMNSLGKLYYKGDCVTQNYSTAVNWFQKAADKGNVEAIGHLGYCYRCGLGVNYAYQKAYELFKQAIDKGDTYSMIQMGFMYEYGEYVEKSTKEANHWYIKAVDAIDKDENLFFLIDYDTLGILYNNLGYNYYAGDGIEKDDEKAFQLLKKSANVYNNEYGMTNLAQMYLDADHILPDTVDYNLAAYSMANDYLYPNHKTAFELLEKADKKGSASARNNLGYYYRFGKYCQQNYKKAFEYFEKSAKHNNDAYGMFQLGLMYDFGEYKEKSSSIANNWYMKAIEKVEKGYYLSDYNLGILYNNLGNNYRNGDGIGQNYHKALELLTKAVQYGDENAMRNLGHMYYYGQGASIDYDKAMELYEQAAKAGNVNAMNDMGYYYKWGEHVQQDYQKAYYWFKQAANQKDNYAMLQLALLYEFGKGVEKSDEKANEWYLKAIQEINDDNNQLDDGQLGTLYNNLGNNYRNGTGIKQNYENALFLLNEAMKYDKEYAARNLGHMYFYGQGVDIDYDRAFELYEEAANAGNVNAINDMGYYHRFGKYIEKDYDKALYWFNQSAAKNDVYGMYQLGIMYDLGYGVDKDKVKANEWYLKAVERFEKDNSLMVEASNRGTLYNNLGNNYRNGAGITQDYQKAHELLNKAMKYDKEYAARNLGHMYYYGQGVDIDYAKAYELYEEAANAGNVNAMDDLGFYYRVGKNVKKDYQKAFHWFEKAATQNDTYALYQLGMMYNYGQYVTKNYTKANEYYTKAIQQVEANHETIGGNTNLGILYSNLGANYRLGNGVEKNYAKAFELLSKSVDYGSAYGNRQLGLMYFNGQGVNIDYPKAFELYIQAANKGNTSAMNDLGFYYKKGQYIEKDLQKAFDWFSKSAHLNSTYAMFQLGIMYGSGLYVEKDYQQSNNYYQKAIDNLSQNNDMGGKTNMGILYKNFALHYYEEKGTTQNYQKAYELFLKAESYGNSVAMYYLGLMYTNGEYVQASMKDAVEYFEKAANTGHKDSLIITGKAYEQGLGVPIDLNKALGYYKQAADKGFQSEEYERLKGKI